MTTQAILNFDAPVIDFAEVLHTKENNSFSQSILEANAERLSNNCKILFEALLRGEKLTGSIIIKEYGMLEYRRRLADIKAYLRNINSPIIISEETISGGCKCWFINK